MPFILLPMLLQLLPWPSALLLIFFFLLQQLPICIMLNNKLPIYEHL